MKTLKDFNLKNKRVLIRADFNVPLGERGIVLDDFRVKKTIPTIEYLMENKAKVILMSHLDDPEGKVIEGLRLTPIQDRLMEYLDVSITKASDCIGSEIEKWSKEMKPGEILLLENLRFHKEEEENNKNFAKELSKLGDIYINDAFGTCHRAHASTTGIPKYLPSGAGLLLEREIRILSEFLKSPQKPLIAIVGGKKVETKAKSVDKISEISDWILVGELMSKEAKEKNIKFNYPSKIISPIDSNNTFDLGPETLKIFKEKIALSKTVFWNGPLGMIEKEEYSKGTEEIARAIIKSGAFSIVGGGETVEFINRLGLTEKFNHVSTGGGAMLEFLAGEELPGIEALK